ncbi:MAG: carboxypeptidase regulatory-like domain-containing protein, partial [Chloroflexi bacterium]
MKAHTKFFSTLSLAVVMTVLLYQVALAATYQLTGQVTDQSGTAIVGATVAVINPATSATVASATTDSTGNYALSVDAGTYDIKVTPPASSGFAESITPGQVISSDTSLDFVLVPAGSITITGRVLDGEGNGLTNQRLQITPSGGNSIGVSTNISGTYTFSVAPGDYRLAVYPNNAIPPSVSALSLP